MTSNFILHDKGIRGELRTEGRDTSTHLTRSFAQRDHSHCWIGSRRKGERSIQEATAVHMRNNDCAAPGSGNGGCEKRLDSVYTEKVELSGLVDR